METQRRWINRVEQEEHHMMIDCQRYGCVEKDQPQRDGKLDLKIRRKKIKKKLLRRWWLTSDDWKRDDVIDGGSETDNERERFENLHRKVWLREEVWIRL